MFVHAGRGFLPGLAQDLAAQHGDGTQPPRSDRLGLDADHAADRDQTADLQRGSSRRSVDHVDRGSRGVQGGRW